MLERGRKSRVSESRVLERGRKSRVSESGVSESRVSEWGERSSCFEQEFVVVIFLRILMKVIGSDVVNHYIFQRFLESVNTSSNSHLHY